MAPKGRDIRLARSIEALQQAEALARIAGVEGPADAIPRKTAEERAFIADWINRSVAALKRAKSLDDRAVVGAGVLESAREKARALKDRARAIARSIANSAEEIYESSPIARANEKFRRVYETAKNATLFGFAGFSITYILGFALSGYILYKLLSKKAA